MNALAGCCKWMFSRRIHQLTIVSNNFLSAPIIQLITGTLALCLVVSGFFSLKIRHLFYNLITSILGVIVLIILIISITLTFLLLDNILTIASPINAPSVTWLSPIKSASTITKWRSTSELCRCFVAGHSISDPEDFVQFLEKHVDGKYYCNICNYSHKVITTVKNHVEAKHFDNSFTYNCPYCDSTFSNRVSLNNHRVKHKAAKAN